MSDLTVGEKGWVWVRRVGVRRVGKWIVSAADGVLALIEPEEALWVSSHVAIWERPSQWIRKVEWKLIHQELV